ncbi:hypothetical protein A3A38_02960 [Candidatus Kaiserbacteria bacterium RIFCSPLOWO2_01_FULL_53_17]|uniref:Uncharacterized protein n=1 Tax=Candidatus Kaiserbacteria bacterium RIFCSPLOWO2_01_FULL_53_17 TaxID=1798511 RepID=A0A1F6EG31_9BACT|nr:MAG: hypothetical protein A3A38_02960 [Candidatus Kaiserbacteria bacterium RIFCSPLOWO2_01_FULL_53_17]
MTTKISDHWLTFPKSLPNDFEALMVFYPAKFPGVISYYEENARKLATDSKGYYAYGMWARDELFEGFDRIKKKYESGDQNDIVFLVGIDQQLHKLYCFRFWVVNYLFPDGPLHEFFVDNLKDGIRKFIDIEEDVEAFEEKILRIQRDLLQGDYADLYLQQTLSGVVILELLGNNTGTKLLFAEAAALIDEHNPENNPKINALWDKIVVWIKSNNSEGAVRMKKELEIPLIQAEFRKTMAPVYNMLTHAVEFREENERLKERHLGMKEKIDELLARAKERLAKDEYDLFVLSYEQARNFGMFKDILGEIDATLLPLWMGLLKKVEKILSETAPVPEEPMGPGGIFYHLVWYLPPDLKAKVMSPDTTLFDLKTL